MDAANYVEVIYKQIIKPSCSTPPHLKTLKLSLLDQLVPPIYIPLIFFYLPNETRGLTIINHAQISQKLKQSLSETLTLFYPSAGRLDHENFVVDCSDYGAEFTEARAHARLSEFIIDPSVEQLKALNIPVAEVPNFLLTVQITLFDCGGIAVGLCLSHQIADLLSTMALLDAWAAICRGDTPDQSPVFGLLAQHFPKKALIDASNNSLSAFFREKGKLVTKRLLFGEEKLAALKRAAACSQSQNTTTTTVKDPTRVELVSAFIWKHLTSASTDKWGQNNTLVASHAINLRPRTSRADDFDLENVFGNCFFITSAFYGGAFDQYEGERAPELGQLVTKLRQAIRGIDDEYVRKAQSGDSYLSDLSKSLDLQSKGGVESCVFSSWCRFPVYEVDYGWGKPVWVGTTSFPIMDSAILMDTKSGQGIEAWITTLHDKMESIESYYKLI